MNKVFVEKIKKEFGLDERVSDNFAIELFKKYEESGFEKIKKIEETDFKYKKVLKEVLSIQDDLHLIEELLVNFNKTKLDIFIHSYFYETSDEVLKEKLILEEEKENNVINNAIKRNKDFKISKKENATEKINSIENVLESLKDLNTLREATKDKYESSLKDLLNKTLHYSKKLYEDRKQIIVNLNKEINLNQYERKIFERKNGEWIQRLILDNN